MTFGQQGPPDLSVFDFDHCRYTSLRAYFLSLRQTMAAIMARHKVMINHWFVSVERTKQGRPGFSRAARQTKAFPTEIEAKQFTKAMLSEGLKVTAGTLSPHQPIRCTITASEINQWIEEEE
jgi:hypothetical protein